MNRLFKITGKAVVSLVMTTAIIASCICVSSQASNTPESNKVNTDVTDTSSTATEYNYEAAPDSTITDNSGLFAVDATYYDYWSDNERSYGYRSCEGCYDTDGKVKWSYDGQSDQSKEAAIGSWWYQFDDFNQYISSKVGTNWTFPLYFGNMYRYDGDGKTDYAYNHTGLLANHTLGWNGTIKRSLNGSTTQDLGSSNYYYLSNGITLKNLSHDMLFKNNNTYAVNNSNGMKYDGGNFNQSIQGLVGEKLDSNSQLLSPDGQIVPYFNGKTLKDATYNSKKVATVTKSVFPFEKSTNGDVTTYSYSSKNAKDNIYFNYDSNNVPTSLTYGTGTSYGINDKLSQFGGSTDGYGLFPFNKPGDGAANKRALNYGFGIRLDIDFRVPENGKLPDGSDVKFNFSGDDDMWVYIGEDSEGANAELALDLGGDHKEATGNINFATMTATADDVYADYSTGEADVKNSSQTRTINGGNHLEANKTYHMVVFYMERGESESNFSVDFTMTPMQNTFAVDKTVDASAVNSTALQNDIKTYDRSSSGDLFKYNLTSTVDDCKSRAFTYTNDISGKTEDKTTSTNSAFNLRDDHSALFNGIFTASTSDTANNMTVKETMNSSNKLSYDPSWTLYDAGKTDSSTTKGYKVMQKSEGTGSAFEFINSDTDYKTKTDLLLSYVNKIKTAPLTINKSVVDGSGTTVTDKNTYTVQVYLDSDFDGTFESDELYDLTYKIGNDSYTMSNGSTDKLSVDSPITIEGLPVGMSYKIVETAPSGYTNINTESELTGTVATAGNTVTVKNQIDSKSVALKVNKTVNSKNYTGNSFKFTETSLKASGTEYVKDKDIESVTTVTNGAVSFKSMSLNTFGTSYYAITEDYANSTTPDYDYQVNDSITIAKVVYDGTTPTVTYAYYSPSDVKSYMTSGEYNYTKLVADFDKYTTATPIMLNMPTFMTPHITKSESLKDNGDGTATIVNPIANAEFTVYPVDNNTVTDFSNITPVAYGKSTSTGEVVFYSDSAMTTKVSSFDIFKSGTNPSDKTYQTYAIVETKAASGYVLNNTPVYLTASDDNVKYDSATDTYSISYGFVNNKITVPSAGAMLNYAPACGMVLVIIALALGTVYFIKRKKSSK